MARVGGVVWMRRGAVARTALVLMAGASLAACASGGGHRTTARSHPAARGAESQAGEAALGGRYKLGAPYQVGGVWYVPADQPDYEEVGVASWYGDEFDGQPTANGERFDMYAASAAHTTLPLPSIVEVTNLENGRSLRLRLNDRGPFKAGRIIDVSRGAARELGFERQGTARVRVRYVGPAKLDGTTEPLYVARNDKGGATPVAWRSPRSAAAPPPPPEPVKAAAREAVPRPAYIPPAVEPAPYVRPAPRAAAISVAELAPPSPGPSFAPPTPGFGEPSYTPAAPGYSPPQPQAQPQWRTADYAAPQYAVQAGSFSDPLRAERVAGLLSQAGSATVRPVDVASRRLYRVMVGPWADEGAAAAAREQVAALGFYDARVVKAF